MKTRFSIFLIVLFLISSSSNAQISFGKIINRSIKRAENSVENRIQNKIDKKVDNSLDYVEDSLLTAKKEKEAIEEKTTRQESIQESKSTSSNAATTQSEVSTNEVKSAAPALKWSKFDFVPGDEVIFEDEPNSSEENGEFPSRWDLADGNAEIAEVDGEKVIIFPHGGTIVPFLKNSKEDYLPEVFTVEFDAYFLHEDPRRIFFSFYDQKNQRHVGERIYIYSKSISYNESSGPYSKNLSKNEWRHFSIAVTKDKLKIYLNDERLINIPHMGFNPTGITIEMDGFAADKSPQYLKNVRIAKGGVKYYDRVLSDGKIIVNGIRFDINKATIKPESNGAINEIYELMKNQPDLKFSVEGHTDSDGETSANQQLSEDRAKAVMERLISMGISANRLKSAGHGESKPLDNNTSSEAKANNRRVEFVRM